MKRFLLLAACLLLVGAVAAKTPPAEPQIPRDEWVVSDGQLAHLTQTPTFKKGGFEKYWQWVLSRVVYPSDMESQKIEGMVRLKIIVETDGTVTAGEVLESPHESLTEAVVRVVENSPKWTPGKMIDEATGEEVLVRVAYTLPVSFKVRPQELVDPTTGRYRGQSDLKPYGSR